MIKILVFLVLAITIYSISYKHCVKNLSTPEAFEEAILILEESGVPNPTEKEILALINETAIITGNFILFLFGVIVILTEIFL